MKKNYAIWLTDLHLELNSIEIVKDIMAQAFMACAVADVEMIILGGDIFDSRKGQPMEVLNAWLEILDLARAKEIRIYCIPGNHDKTDYSKDESFLDVYNTHPNFELYDTEKGFHSPIEGNLSIHFLPYYNDEVYFSILKKMKVKKDGTNILFTHIGIDGAMANGNFAIESDLKAKAFNKFDHVYVGHYHNFIDMKLQ